MNLSLKTITHSVVGLLLVVSVANITFVVRSVGEQKTHITDARTVAGTVGGDYLQLVQEIHAIKYDIAQVQQWLTDISATRGLDGLDDGPKQAEEFARDLERTLTTATRRSDTLGLKLLKDALGQVDRAFAPYYETGKRMAKAYVQFGPEGGNALMAEFDKTAEAIQDRLDHTNTLLETAVASAVGRMEEKLASVNRQGEFLFNASLASGALMTGVVIAVAFVLLRLIIAPLG